MSSQATTDGLMTLTVTFKLGTDPDKAQQLVQNRVAQAEPRLPEEVRALGITTVKSSPDLTMVVHLLSPNDRYDMTYLRNYARAQRQGPPRAHRGRRPGADVRRAATIRCASGSIRRRSPSAACRPSDVVDAIRGAERAGRGRRRRRVARRCPSSTCSCRSTRRAACRPRRSSATSSSRPAPNGAGHAPARRRPHRAWRRRLFAALAARQQAGGRAFRSSRRPAPTRIADLRQRPRDDGRAARRTCPKASTTRSSTTRRSSCAPRSRRSIHTLLEADRAGRAGRHPVPADLARVDHSAARGAGVDHRHLRGDACVRLLDQRADAVRAGAGDRHRRRRRDRRGRERRAQHRGRAVAARGRPIRPCAKCPGRSSPSRWCWSRCSCRSPSSPA